MKAERRYAAPAPQPPAFRAGPAKVQTPVAPCRRFGAHYLAAADIACLYDSALGSWSLKTRIWYWAEPSATQKKRCHWIVSCTVTLWASWEPGPSLPTSVRCS
jgi:hypothetical protein